MRDIKFRALDATTCEWVYYGTAITGTVDHLQLKGDTESQYTGLKDKNGTEIYEGDLIEISGNNNGTAEVKFINAYVGGWNLVCGESYCSLGARESSEVEVVGNAFEGLVDNSVF